MPINACSINTYSVDAICVTKRAKYIDILWGTPVVGNKGKGGWTGYYPEFKSNEDDYKINVIAEQPVITIQCTFDGETIISSFENSQMHIVPLISINKLSSNPSNIDVDVINITIGKV